jgi:hypothetical protein
MTLVPEWEASSSSVCWGVRNEKWGILAKMPGRRLIRPLWRAFQASIGCEPAARLGKVVLDLGMGRLIYCRD